MKILLLDSTSKTTNVSLFFDGQTTTFKTTFPSSSSISLFIKNIFDITKTTASDLDAVVLPKTGASFTGIRICYASAFGITSAFDVPIIQIDPLDCFAKKLENLDNVIVPIIQISKEQVYFGKYKKGVPLCDLQTLDIQIMLQNLEKDSIITGYEGDAFSEHHHIYFDDVANEYFLLSLEKLQKQEYDNGIAKYLKEAL